MEDQLALTSVIKGVHSELRAKSLKLGPERAWEEHCKNTAALEGYAVSMKTLAVNVWDKNNMDNGKLCRNQWIYEHCRLYFVERDSERFTEKEQKLCKYFGVPPLCTDVGQLLTEGTKVKVLDVGSCYNPLKKFDIFDVLAVDLTPAASDVLKCDFLTVGLGEFFKKDGQVETLPKGYFDVVVFSLFLEYLPCSTQRYSCCKKACQCLKPGGMLVIITPDSNHESSNSRTMKMWRYCLASLGLMLVYSEKLKHLRCMSYRKCFRSESTVKWLEKRVGEDFDPCDKLVIPQDGNTEYCCHPSEPEIVSIDGVHDFSPFEGMLSVID